ncbi:hypothetical protein ACIBCD_02990 [Nocardia brasiliensis]|uniref:hypothetical protein n=1 Tax=Nocardia brasiliensis TaxID=37326 RepID=UPI00313D0D52
MDEWEIFITDEVEQFLDDLWKNDRQTHRLVNQAILLLERAGPAQGVRLSTASQGRGSPT